MRPRSFLPRVSIGLLFLAPLAPGRSPTPHEQALLELDAPRRAWYVGERVRLELRLGLERELLRGKLVQLFARPLDLPVQVVAPWLEGLPEARALELPPDPAGRRVSLVLGEQVVFARAAGERPLDGRTFELFELELELAARRPGELVLAAPVLRYAFATDFRDDPFEGRVPLDRLDASVRGEALALEVLPWPEEGRPPEFTGAVGSFRLEASLEPRSVEVGGSVSLILRIEGEGNFGSFEAPSLERLEGFHLRGRLEEIGATRHVVTYDLAPRSERLSELPPIHFAYFDPRPPASYRFVATRALPLDVRPRAELAPAPTDAAADAGAPRARETAAGERDLPSRASRLALAAGLCCVLLLLAVVARRRARSRAQVALPSEAARAFHARLAEPGCELERALLDYLAARLGSTAAALVGPGVEARLEASGAAPELAARAASLLEELLAARYGGPAPRDAHRRARALVDELEPALAPSR